MAHSARRGKVEGPERRKGCRDQGAAKTLIGQENDKQRAWNRVQSKAADKLKLAKESPFEPKIEVDPRAGSGKYLGRLGEVAVSARLKAGDFAWAGKTREGTARIGVELKTLSDAVACMRSGRFAANQYADMLRLYDYRYLVVQGCWRCDQDGNIEDRRGFYRPFIPRTNYVGFRHWLASVRMAGFAVVELQEPADVANWLVSEFSWWQKTEHTSLRQADFTPTSGLIGVESPAVRNSWARKMLRAAPALGWTRSLAAARHFKSIKRAVNATAAEWAEVEGVGKTLANQLVAGFESELIA